MTLRHFRPEFLADPAGCSAYPPASPCPQSKLVHPNVTVITGPARSGKTSELLDRYATGLAAAPMGGIGRQLWLSPTSRVAASVRDALGGMTARLPRARCRDVRRFGKKNPARRRREDPIIAAVAQRELLRRIIATAR